MGQVDEYEFEERVSGFARSGSRNDSARRRRHYQHQFACREKCVCRRRYLLRFKMGRAGIERVHGGRVARTRNTREHGLSRKCGDRVFRAWTQGPGKGIETRRRGSCGSNDCDARGTEFCERGRIEASAEDLVSRLTTVVITTIVRV